MFRQTTWQSKNIKRFLSSAVGSSFYSNEANALFARFTSQPTDARKTLINNLIVSLKNAGVWTKLDALYILAAHDAQAAQRNWKADSFNLTPVSTPTFTTDRGYAGNGTSSYLTTGYTPSTAGGNMFTSTAHISLWSRNNIASSSQIPIGARTDTTTRQLLICPRLGTDVATYRVNQDVSGNSPASLDSTGFWLARRSGAASVVLYKNGASFDTGTDASTGLPAAAVTIGALNTGGVVGSFSTHQIAAASLGASLFAQEVTDMYSALNTYLTAVGAA